MPRIDVHPRESGFSLIEVLVALAIAALSLLLIHRIGADMASLIAFGALNASARFLAAPAMAYLSERRLASANPAPHIAPPEGALQPA